ncbi:MAG: hypothetical protein Q8Q12_05175 [bacterium]|nr:hypothetical protein [bacterium]
MSDSIRIVKGGGSLVLSAGGVGKTESPAALMMWELLFAARGGGSYSVSATEERARLAPRDAGLMSPPDENLLEYFLGTGQLEGGRQDDCPSRDVNDHGGLGYIGYQDLHAEEAKALAPLLYPIFDVHSFRPIACGFSPGNCVSRLSAH